MKLAEYIELSFLEAGVKCKSFDYITELCSALEDLVLQDLPGGKKNLLINMPPRHFKTTIVSQLFPAWCLSEVAEDCEFLLTSYSAELATENSVAIKRQLSSSWHEVLYPNVRVSATEKDLQKMFKTTSGGSVYATGLGGTITGFGAGKSRRDFSGAIIIDDPLKAGEERSATKTKNCINYYNNVLKSRRNSANVPIVLVMQRLGIKDLTNWILQNEPEDWHIISFPAIDADGRLLNPEQVTLEQLNKLKEVSPETFYAQYQQTPIAAVSLIIKPEWFKDYLPTELKQTTTRFITADTAFEEGDSNDNSVMQCWQINPEGLYLVDAVWGKWDFPTLVQRAKDFYVRNASPKEIWIESKASGTSLVQTLQQEGLPAFKWKPSDFNFPADKVGRMQASAWNVYNGEVFVPQGSIAVYAGDRKFFKLTQAGVALLEEILSFTQSGSGEHDDHCDAFTMAVSLYKDYKGY